MVLLIAGFADPVAAVDGFRRGLVTCVAFRGPATEGGPFFGNTFAPPTFAVGPCGSRHFPMPRPLSVGLCRAGATAAPPAAEALGLTGPAEALRGGSDSFEPVEGIPRDRRVGAAKEATTTRGEMQSRNGISFAVTDMFPFEWSFYVSQHLNRPIFFVLPVGQDKTHLRHETGPVGVMRSRES